jgi:WD40 repeat protein
MVSGIAGSSLAGPGVHPGGQVRIAAISPSREYAVVADERGAVVFYGQATGRGGVTSVSLWNDSSRVTHAAVSPSGDRFAIYSADSGRLAVYEVQDGNPGNATVSSAPWSGGEITRLAVADQNRGVFAIARNGSGADVLRLGNDGARSVASLSDASDLALFSGSSRALILDSAQSALYEIDLASASPTLNLFASQANGIEKATALALSGDDRSVAVVSNELRRATVIDLATRGSRNVELPEAPNGVRRLNARGVFQVTDASAGPILLLEVQQDNARTVYVPRASGGRAADDNRAGLR